MYIYIYIHIHILSERADPSEPSLSLTCRSRQLDRYMLCGCLVSPCLDRVWGTGELVWASRPSRWAFVPGPFVWRVPRGGRAESPRARLACRVCADRLLVRASITSARTIDIVRDPAWPGSSHSAHTSLLWRRTTSPCPSWPRASSRGLQGASPHPHITPLQGLCFWSI